MQSHHGISNAISNELLNSNCNGKCSSNVANEKFNSELRNWLDSLPLSKPVQSPGRDFSDAVMAAEIVAHFLPRYITLNSFVHVHSLALKKYNWESLHKVVLRHLGIRLGPELIDGLARGDDDGAIELFLPLLRSKINDALAQRRFRPSSRSQSRSCSRGGSQLHLDQIGAASGSQSARGQGVGGQQKNTAAVERPTGQAVEGAKNKDRQIPVLDEMDKDQLIERLYAKVRAQETQLIRKDEQIEALTRRVDKLVELICEKKRRDRPMDGSGNQMQNNNSNNCDFD